LARLKTLFILPTRKMKAQTFGGPSNAKGKGTSLFHLKKLEDRPTALVLLDKMNILLKKLEAHSPAETMRNPDRLKNLFLEPMHTTIKLARIMSELESLEYWLNDFQEQMVKLFRDGRAAAAEQEIAKIRPKVMEQVSQFAEALKELEGVKEWAARWQQRFSGLDYWKKLAASRRLNK